MRGAPRRQPRPPLPPPAPPASAWEAWPGTTTRNHSLEPPGRFRHSCRVRYLHCRLLASLLLLLAAPAAVPAQQGPPPPAQDAPAGPVLPYRVTILPTGDAALDQALQDSSQLASLQEQAPTGAAGILARAMADRDRLAEAMHSLGYWGAGLRILIAGEPMESPALAARLESLQARLGEEPVAVRIEPQPGPLYRIGRLTLNAPDPAGAAAIARVAEEPYGLAPGDPAAATAVLAAERTLLDRLLAAGHPLATVARRQTLVDHDRRAMDVTWNFAPGPVARFATPEVDGAVKVNTAFLRRQAARLAGEPYSPERLEKARRELMALGAFDSVRARAAERLDAEGRLPVTFTVTERLRHALGINAAYETNYGPSVRVYWEHRNLFGRAERLRLEAEVARIGTSGDIGDMTYRVGASLRAPGLFGQDLTLVGSIAALRERLEAYDRDAVTFSALLERRLSESLTLQAGPVLDFGRAGPPDGRLRPYQTVGVLLGGRWDGTDSLLDPGRGWRAQASVTPSYSVREGAPFAPLRLTASTYWDLLGDKRGILAVRGSIGSLLGAARLDVPPHQRLYAGGGGSVRGYDYQSIGPRDARNKPAGGASLLETSLEWRQRVWGDFGAVAFVDAGTVGTGSLPDLSNLRVGAGLGVRYYTAIGPIRADVAFPLVRQTGSSGYGLYVGIGQAF